MNNMTLDEAIRHCEEVAEENQAIVDACDYYGDNMARCDKYANEHRQLAKWLKDYKRLLKENEKNTGKDIATAFQFGMALGFAKKCDECDKIDNSTTREEQISNGFTEMMRGFWNNQNLEVLNFEMPCKQEFCEDDAISRQVAIDAFEKFIHELGIEDEPYNYGEMALSAKNVPPVTPQQKIGRWIRVDKDKLKCSECEVTHLIAQYPNGKINWCPNCGAKMEIEGE